MNERKTKKCDKCDHIYWEDEPHECPTEDYIARRNRLISEALDEYEASGEVDT